MWRRVDLRRATTTATARSVPMFKRTLAVPVNPATSIDPVLGTAAPPPPSARTEPRSADENADDSETLSEMLNNRPSSSNGDAAKRARIERLRNSAMGSTRRSSAIPSTDNLLANALDNAKQQLHGQLPLDVNPQAKEANPELPHDIDGPLRDRAPIERFAVAAAREMQRQQLSTTPLSALHGAIDQRANVQLSVELPYEPNPKEDRRVPVTSALSSPEEVASAAEDGVLLLCFIDKVGSGKERVSLCSGFAIQGGSTLESSESDGHGELVVSCLHTVRLSTDEEANHS